MKAAKNGLVLSVFENMTEVLELLPFVSCIYPLDYSLKFFKQHVGSVEVNLMVAKKMDIIT